MRGAVRLPRPDHVCLLLSFFRLMTWAASAGVPGDFVEVCASPQACAHVLAGLERAGQGHALRSFERVAAVVLEPEVGAIHFRHPHMLSSVYGHLDT